MISPEDSIKELIENVSFFVSDGTLSERAGLGLMIASLLAFLGLLIRTF